MRLRPRSGGARRACERARPVGDRARRRARHRARVQGTRRGPVPGVARVPVDTGARAWSLLPSVPTGASSAPPCALRQTDRVAAVLDETGLWRDLTELPETLAATLDARSGFSEVAARLGAPGVKRVVASGNGAAYYVCLALWLASLEGRRRPRGRGRAERAASRAAPSRGAQATCSSPSPRRASSAT